jgi:transcriptional regulator with XRE-family HTH domain
MSNIPLAIKIRKAREKNRLTRYRVAKDADISYSFYCAIEDGESQNPSFEKVCSIAKAIGVSILEFADQ